MKTRGEDERRSALHQGFVCPIRKRLVQCTVPEGRLIVAQHFSAGKTGETRTFFVPEGRLKPYFKARFSVVPPGQIGFCSPHHPAMNRWATVKCPCGTTQRIQLASDHERAAPRHYWVRSGETIRTFRRDTVGLHDLPSHEALARSRYFPSAFGAAKTTSNAACPRAEIANGVCVRPTAAPPRSGSHTSSNFPRIGSSVSLTMHHREAPLGGRRQFRLPEIDVHAQRLEGLAHVVPEIRGRDRSRCDVAKVVAGEGSWAGRRRDRPGTSRPHTADGPARTRSTRPGGSAYSRRRWSGVACGPSRWS